MTFLQPAQNSMSNTMRHFFQVHKVSIMLLCFVVLVCLPFLSLSVIHQTVTVATLFVWLGSIVITCHALRQPSQSTKRKKKLFHKDLVFLITIALGMLILFGTNVDHFHYDEDITAYTSWSLPSIEQINWFGVVPGKGEWVSQFPLLYHILQKPFLLLQQSQLMIRISTWPYTLGAVILFYLLLEDLFSRSIAFTSSFCFIMLAPELYLGSLGLHFHSSMFFFILSLYSFFQVFLYKTYQQSVLLGLAMTGSYMTYTSSYIVGPLILLCCIVSFCFGATRQHAKLFVSSFTIALLALFPFLVYAITVNNFFTQRVDQVSIFTGSWRSQQDIATNLPSLLSILSTHITQAAEAMVLPHIGGAGEYWFGHQSFFEPIGAMFFVIGISLSLCLLIKKRSLPFLILLLAFVAPFIVGVILTMLPIPFHRLSIAYPLIGFFIAQGVLFGKKTVEKYLSVSLARSIVVFVLFSYSVSNILHAEAMIATDYTLKTNDILKATAYIKTNVPPQTPIFIAAFPTNAFGKELFFRTEHMYPITTNYLEELPITKPSVLILNRPNAVSFQEIATLFPNAHIIKTVPLQEYAIIRL